MWRLFAVLLALVPAAPVARAGAWLRGDGVGFVAVSATLRQAGEALRYETALYAEYGATPRLTLGIDLNGHSGLAGHALGFLRLPLSRPGARNLIAADLAAGAHNAVGRWQPMARAGLSLGRGFASRRGDGWIGLDAAWERRFGLDDGAFKLDFTAGLSTGPRLRPLLQIETYNVPGRGLDWATTASVMVDDRRGRTWVIGLRHSPSGGGSTGLKAALWRRF